MRALLERVFYSLSLIGFSALHKVPTLSLIIVLAFVIPAQPYDKSRETVRLAGNLRAITGRLIQRMRLRNT
ncbi:hypothetical protein BJ170DRAFT_164220 [Xylariales sp. AK1849]|nr:hypothetical protein BJ170DRAFT_164220 [Xylariales sp. AK1849]